MRDMDLRQIEIFIAVARQQNISRAAQDLYISQPAISNWIAKMEADCGEKLFYRTNRGVSLTPKGEEIYARLDIVYNRFRVSVAEICGDPSTQNAALRIGCLNRQQPVQVANQIVQAWRERCPEKLVFEEMFNFHELRSKLLCQELDFAFSLSFDIQAYDTFECRPLCPYQVFFVVSEAWRAMIGGGDGLPFLDGRTLVVEAPTSAELALAVCQSNGFQPGGVRYVDSYILMAALASRNQGFSIAGVFGLQNVHYPQIAMLPVPGGWGAQIVLAWQKGRMTPAMERFLSLLDEMEGTAALPRA